MTMTAFHGDPAALVAGSDVGRSEATPLRIEPERGQVAEYTSECSHGTGCSSSPGLPKLPTPQARDWKGRNQRGDDTCLPGAVATLPTPRTSDANGASSHGTGGPDLRTVIAELAD